MAVVATGPQTKGLASPMSVDPTRTCQTGVWGPMTTASHTSEPEKSAVPAPARRRGWSWSVSLPASGAMTKARIDCGASRRAAWVGVIPLASWAQIMKGKIIAVTAKPMVVMATLASEKLRSEKRLSGTSGSRLVRDCHQTKIPSRATPTPSSRGTDTGPQIVPHPYAWASCSPKTKQNRPTALSATPTRSTVRACVSSRGTRRSASANPTTPTGTLTKKIHSQPSVSTRIPPSSGPASVATPAVAPHRAIALPRRWAGKVRVMTAIVCGVIIEAPRPCSTLAAISPPIPWSSSPVIPHHSEAMVKTVRPVR